MAGRPGSLFGEMSGIRAPTWITCVYQSAFTPQQEPTECAVFDSLSVPTNAGTYAQGNARSSGLSYVPLCAISRDEGDERQPLCQQWLKVMIVPNVELSTCRYGESSAIPRGTHLVLFSRRVLNIVVIFI